MCALPILPEEKIVADISEWAKHTSKRKLSSYVKNYPKSVAEIAARVIR
jgi:hypothetical protein